MKTKTTPFLRWLAAMALAAGATAAAAADLDVPRGDEASRDVATWPAAEGTGSTAPAPVSAPTGDTDAARASAPLCGCGERTAARSYTDLEKDPFVRQTWTGP